MRHFRKSFQRYAAVTAESIRPATYTLPTIMGSRKRPFGKLEHKELPYAPFREAHVTEGELSSRACYDAGTRVASGVFGGPRR